MCWRAIGTTTFSVRGETLRPTRASVLARGASISAAKAKEVIDRVAGSVAHFPALARKLKVPRTAAGQVEARLSEVRQDFERR